MQQRLRSQFLALLGAATLSFQSMATTLYLPPELSSPPYTDASVKELSSAAELVTLFKQLNYTLDGVRHQGKVPAIYVENLPHDLNALPGNEKQLTFIRLLLPTLIAVNEDILRARKSLSAVVQKHQQTWTAQEQAWMNKLLQDYGVKANNYQALLLQLDLLPIGLSLAQGIDESGWGTSHFAVAETTFTGNISRQVAANSSPRRGGMLKWPHLIPCSKAPPVIFTTSTAPTPIASCGY